MIELPNSNEVSRIADWIELYILFEEKPISKNKIISILEDSAANADEDKVDSAIQELSRRLMLYGNTKPFEINNNVVSPKFSWEQYPEFTLCLYYSTYGAGNPDKGTKLFEKITQVCIENFLNCKCYIFGFPSPDTFKVQLDKFAKLIKENRNDDPDPQDKDRGVDLIAWKTLDEVRNNLILFFIQCAAGKNWNDKKPVAIESYRRYFSFCSKATISSLSVTQILDIEDWQKAADDYGILIDRARLYKMITADNYVIENKLREEIKKWCKAKLN